MLLCQDETRNISRKSNSAKKERGEEIKLSRRRLITQSLIHSSFSTVAHSALSSHLSPHSVIRPALVQYTANSDSGSFKRTRKPSAALRESVSSEQTQKRWRDSETAAIIANCDVSIEEQEQEPRKKAQKKASKVKMNKSFFSALSRSVDVDSTSFFF